MVLKWGRRSQILSTTSEYRFLAQDLLSMAYRAKKRGVLCQMFTFLIMLRVKVFSRG